jgi:hypothetical protein
VSVNDLTIRAAVIAGLAIVALVLTGWRKTARATPKTWRGGSSMPRQVPVMVERQPTPPYRPPNPARRLVALVSSGAISLVVAAVIATVTALGIALIVTTMTNLLKQ